MNLRDAQIRGNHNPGAGGWPTIRYFNKQTGYEGASYEKKTSKSMCDELGDEEMMQAYVEEAGNTGLFSCLADGTGCDEKETNYLTKFAGKSAEDVQKQVTRLNGMKTNSKMSATNRQWLAKRLNILKQLQKQSEHVHDEL